LPQSPRSDSIAATAVFDREVALRRCLNKIDMLQEMVECFFCEADTLFPQMRSALKKGDLVEVGRLGHRMKGTVVYLGAEAAREAALRVEHFERHPGIEAEAKEAVNSLEKACEALKSALVAYRTTA
jgi:HPt (histidine-containing phosphotransfer) domain-containing protein